jgi:hypothetical protein
MPSTFYVVAKEAVSVAHRECHYLDLAEGFMNEGYQGAPGRELFLEHVHYTFEGHYIVGKLIAKAVLEQCLQATWSEKSAADLAEATELLGFLPEDELAATSLVIQMVRSGPFANCLDRELQEAELVVHAASVFESMSEPRRSVFADLMLSQMADNLLAHLQAAHRARGNAAFADELLARRKQRTPWGMND